MTNIPTANVLVVDDEPTIRETLERLLTAEGYTLTVASDGQEALDVAQTREFEVVLMDIMMPRLSGVGALRRFAHLYPDTSVIMATAVADLQQAVETMQLGAYDYVLKPFNLDDVLIKVRRAREQRLLRLQVRGHKQELDRKMQETEIRLQKQFEQLVLCLAREHTMAIEIETLRQAKRGKALFSSLPKELQQPKASVEEFVQVLIEMIRSDRVR